MFRPVLLLLSAGLVVGCTQTSAKVLQYEWACVLRMEGKAALLRRSLYSMIWLRCFINLQVIITEPSYSEATKAGAQQPRCSCLQHSIRVSICFPHGQWRNLDCHAMLDSDIVHACGSTLTRCTIVGNAVPRAAGIPNVHESLDSI